MTKSWLFLFSAFVFLICGSAFAEAPADKPKTLVVIGDSLTEGYGVARESSFVALLEKKIAADGKKWKIVNAGVSGATSASGPSRIKWQLKAKPELVILALGANDALRGLKPEQTEKNLADSIELAQKEKVKLILAGMLAPPNYGKEYGDKFIGVFDRLEKKYKVPRIPFLLKDVAGESKLNQADGIHPNEKGHEIMAKNIYDSIKDFL